MIARLVLRETNKTVDRFYVTNGGVYYADGFSVRDTGIYTFDGLSLEYGKTIETQGTTGNKPVSYITALALAKGGFKIHADARFVDVRKRVNLWKNCAEDNRLYYFMIGETNVFSNPIIIDSVKVSNIKINGSGKWLSADIDVSFQEYAGGNAYTIGILQKRLEDYS